MAEELTITVPFSLDTAGASRITRRDSICGERLSNDVETTCSGLANHDSSDCSLEVPALNQLVPGKVGWPYCWWQGACLTAARMTVLSSRKR